MVSNRSVPPTAGLVARCCGTLEGESCGALPRRTVTGPASRRAVLAWRSGATGAGIATYHLRPGNVGEPIRFGSPRKGAKGVFLGNLHREAAGSSSAPPDRSKVGRAY